MDAACHNRGIILRKNKKLFQIKAKEDPFSQWECEQKCRTLNVQHNQNQFLLMSSAKQACDYLATLKN